MRPADLQKSPESIRRLADELAALEAFIGHPEAPADLEARVIDLAHRLRNELQIKYLVEHAADHPRLCPV